MHPDHPITHPGVEFTPLQEALIRQIADPDEDRLCRIGYELCEHLRARGVVYDDAVADPLVARLLRRTGQAYLDRLEEKPDTEASE